MNLGRTPMGPYKQMIRNNSSVYSVDRRVDEESAYGSNYDYEEDAAEADLWLFLPEDHTEIMITGEQESGSLQGLCLVDEDIQKYDRVNYGQGRYEVDDITDIPDPMNAEVKELYLSTVVESELM